MNAQHNWRAAHPYDASEKEQERARQSLTGTPFMRQLAQAKADEFLETHPAPLNVPPERWAWAILRAMRYRPEGVETMTMETIAEDQEAGRTAFPEGLNPAACIGLVLNILWREAEAMAAQGAAIRQPIDLQSHPSDAGPCQCYEHVEAWLRDEARRLFAANAGMEDVAQAERVGSERFPGESCIGFRLVFELMRLAVNKARGDPKK